MIGRMWRGWTGRESVGACERVVRGAAVPAIAARRAPGFLHIDLLRRDDGEEVEFTTLMRFASLDAVRGFTADDQVVAHVPEAARGVLWRFDARAARHAVLDRRPQDQPTRNPGRTARSIIMPKRSEASR